jgi:hypothetical protein
VSASMPCSAASNIAACRPTKSPGRRKFKICRRPSGSVLNRNAVKLRRRVASANDFRAGRHQ